MEYKLPLGILRHCIKALDIGMNDLREASVDEDLDESTAARLESFAEMLGNIGAGIINLVADEIGEDDFIREEIPGIDELQDSDEDLMNQELDSF